jgi:hypothetical protein
MTETASRQTGNPGFVEPRRLKIVWMDGTRRIFSVAKVSHDDATILADVIEPANGPYGEQIRKVRYPLANIRWYGDPGNEVGW